MEASRWDKEALDPRHLKRLTLILCAGYALWFGLYLLLTGSGLAWPLLLIPPLIVYQWRTSRRSQWVGLIPLAILLLNYLSLGAFSGGLDRADIHVVDLISWERALFGGIPAAWLQRLLLNSVVTPLLDLIANVIYLSHFVVPTVLGLALWKRDEKAFWSFFFGFLLLSYAAFLTYVFFPAAPPWWASREGYLGGLEAVTLDHFILAGFASSQAPNPVAAMPSLHCAYPFFYFLCLGPLLKS